MLLDFISLDEREEVKSTSSRQHPPNPATKPLRFAQHQYLEGVL